MAVIDIFPIIVCKISPLTSCFFGFADTSISAEGDHQKLTLWLHWKKNKRHLIGGDFGLPTLFCFKASLAAENGNLSFFFFFYLFKFFRLAF
jgi:hypothetical protein